MFGVAEFGYEFVSRRVAESKGLRSLIFILQFSNAQCSLYHISIYDAPISIYDAEIALKETNASSTSCDQQCRWQW